MNVFTQALLVIKNSLAFIRRDHNNYYTFGDGDRLPNEMVRAVNDSGTARACVSKISQFVQGNGFVDATLGASEANIHQTNNAALGDLSQISAYFNACTFRVVFDNSGMPARYYPVQTQKLRRVGLTQFRYNVLYGEHGWIKKDDVVLQIFDPKESGQSRLLRMAKQLEEYGEQWGDMVYFFKKGVSLYGDIYPNPDYYAAIDDIYSDAGITRLELRNIKKGWRTPVIVSTGPIDKDNRDDNGDTEYDKLARNMKRFAGEDAAYALHIEGATEAAKPTVTTINIADILNQTDLATDRVGKKVCRAFSVPPILVGFSTPGQLGNTQELKNSMDLFKMTVVERQDLIKHALSHVWPNKNWEISKLTLWENTNTTGNEAAKV